jgi:hypothetical protein
VALAAIRKTFALDFFGIDCGLDRSGRLVVFEVNTSMLVHPHNAAFPYKMPHVQAIKAAFDALLGRLARGGAKGVSSVPGTAQASIGGLCTKPCRSPG